MVAPNNGYGAYNTTTNPSPVLVSAAAGTGWSASFDFLLESSSIYTTNNFGGSGFSRIFAYGWEDNL